MQCCWTGEILKRSPGEGSRMVFHMGSMAAGFPRNRRITKTSGFSYMHGIGYKQRSEDMDMALECD